MTGEQPRYDFHTHSFFSDGELIPIELIRRAYVIGYRAIAVTDHVSFSNVDDVVPAIARDCENVDSREIVAIPGAEITHVPPGKIDELVKRARRAGAKVVVVHGETPVEPVSPGTNRRAAENPDVDILAHPGHITRDEAELARENGVFLEITCRNGHSMTNGHVFSVGNEVGAEFLVNTDAHDSEDLADYDRARRVALGAGMSESIADRVLLENPKTLLRKIGLP